MQRNMFHLLEGLFINLDFEYVANTITAKTWLCTSIYSSPYKYSLTDIYGNGTVFVCRCEELTLTKHKRNRGIIELLSKTWTAREKPPENYNSL